MKTHTEITNSINKPSDDFKNMQLSLNTRHSFETFIHTYSSSYPKIIFFITASWCNPCKLAKPIVYDYAAKYRDILLIELDFDASRETVHYLKVKSVPSLVSFYLGNKDNVCFGCSDNQIKSIFQTLQSLPL